MDKTVFGEDAEEFNPERWLESEERTREMEKYLITFGAGSRTCVGKNISLMVAPNFESLADRYRKSIKLFLRFSGIST